MRKFSKIDKNEIIKAICKAKNQVNVLHILDVNNSGGSRRSLRNFISENNIDISHFEKKLTRNEYESNPKLCKQCGNPIPWSNHLGEFCSNSCSTSYTNKKRKLSEETKKKISESLQKNNPNFDGIIKPVQERNKIRSSKEKRYCLNCGDELNRNQTKYCCSDCQTDYENRQYVERWKQGLEDGLRGEYQLSKHVYRYLFKTRGCKCEVCGWGEVNPHTNTIPVEIHHKDGNYLNNTEENLQILCPNCHSLTETYKSHNKEGRKGRKKYYSDSEE